jgi:hypothetical protein
VTQLDALFVIAELAVAFAGFASIVAILGRRAGRDDPELDGSRIRSMLDTSLLVVAFALIPLLPLEAGLSDQASWRLSAAAFAISGALLLVRMLREVTRLKGVVPGYEPARSWLATSYFLMGSAILVLTAAATAVLSPALFRVAYLWALYSYLTLSGLLFLRLVQSLIAAKAE